MTQGAASYREDVEQLRLRFEEFRSTHAVRSRLPEELWVAAAKLARRDGIEATAQALDVDRPSLQKWTNRFEPHSEATPRKPRCQRQSKREPAAAAFMELPAGNTGATASCLVYWLETFVDTSRFRGTCYRAANWHVIGTTAGRGHRAPTFEPSRPVKQMLGLSLHRKFRELLCA